MLAQHVLRTQLISASWFGFWVGVKWSRVVGIKRPFQTQNISILGIDRITGPLYILYQAGFKRHFKTASDRISGKLVFYLKYFVTVSTIRIFRVGCINFHSKKTFIQIDSTSKRRLVVVNLVQRTNFYTPNVFYLYLWRTRLYECYRT